ncbi:MAG: phage tail tape measure protein, partial [Fibrobacter sp.]|nr:phage tail tape measure protein [Fibrobacter sp.]
MATTSELTLRIGADPTKLKTGLKQSSAAIDSFGSKAKASIARVGASMRGLADRMVTPFNSLVLGGGLGMAIKSVGDLSETLMYYSMAAKKSDADTKVFRESLHKMAVETGVDANSILNGISKIGEITGDFDFAEKMSVSLAKASKASKTSIEDLAAVASSMKGSMGYSADQVLNAFNALIIQGEKGSFTLQSFAAEGKALLASASTFGIKSTDQFAKFGSFLQIVNEKIKSSAETTTSVSALFSELIDKAADIKKKFGVRVFDKNNELREFDVIIKEIMAKTGGSLKKLSPVFGASSMKAINPLIGEFQNNWERMDDIAKAGIEGMKNSDVLEDYYQKASNSFNSNVDKMKNVALEFADTQLTGPVEKLTDALKYLSKHQGIVTAGFQAMKVAALALAAVKVGGFVKSIGGLASDIKGIWSGKKGGNTASSSPLDAVQKVYVVNMGNMGSSNYMDDDDPGFRGLESETVKNAPELGKLYTGSVKETSKEMGRFRTAVSSARGGLNRLGNTMLGRTALTAATAWAMNQIENFGQAFIEWRNVVADAESNSAAAVSTNDKTFREKYGSSAAHWSDKASAALLEAQKEGNSLFGSQKRIDQLMADFQKYSKLASDEIKKQNAADYMKNMTVAPNIVINMDP